MSRSSGSVSLLLMLAASLSASFGITAGLITDIRDANTMQLVQRQWENTPPSWKDSTDPCGSGWDGVFCTSSRIVSLVLSSMNLTGQMPDEIGDLTGLQILVLAYNPGLTGPISSSLGNLQHLRTLILIGCRFTGRIPEELGNLRNLVTLDVNSNGLSESLPPSLGNLHKLFWLDVGNNSINGQLPVELNGLVNCRHFHFNKNQLSGSIPPDIFHKNMSLINVLFDRNLFTGEIPPTLGDVSTLQRVRLDRNSFEGQTPSSIGQLQLVELDLSNNKLNGSIPDLSGMSTLQYLDLSNNSFSVSNVPAWLTVLGSLFTLVMENSSLNGQLPSKVFSLPQLEKVKLPNNYINGSLKLDADVTQQLQLIDLRYNNIATYLYGFTYTNTLLLQGNPACSTMKAISNDLICLLEPEAIAQTSYQTEKILCGNNMTCSGDLVKFDPRTCDCAMPYVGTMFFRAPTFSSLTNSTRFKELENSMWTGLNLTNGSVYICCMSFDTGGYLSMQLQLFPTPGRMQFNRSEILNLSSALSSRTYIAPDEFGPYYFIPTELYIFLNEGRKASKSLSSGAIIGIAVGASVSIFATISLGIYALRERRKAGEAFQSSNPIASWVVPNGGDSGDAPKLKSARFFSFQELKQATNNFSADNEIGSGGYGKVYKGILAVGGEMVAVKRAKKESKKGKEFKTEIELLSRVHHKNLVALLGFCFEGEKQMLVYEYMPNGSLRDSLSGKTGIHLDWRKRSLIALGVARGLAYLHDHADPHIIHRDVKSANILLDKNMVAKVSDFGLSKLIADTDTAGPVSTVRGTMGYLDPEYHMSQRPTHKTDVYSFGVVLMELLASRPPLVEGGKYLVREVRAAMKMGGVDEVRRQILDPLLRDSPISETHLESFVRLSLRCADDSATNRPKMSDVVKELETITESLNGTRKETYHNESETYHNESETVNFPFGGHHPNYPYANGTSSDSSDYIDEFSMTLFFKKNPQVSSL